MTTMAQYRRRLERISIYRALTLAGIIRRQIIRGNDHMSREELVSFHRAIIAQNRRQREVRQAEVPG